jgi:hypothetical protein
MARANFAWLFCGILLLLVLQPAAQTGVPGIAASVQALFTSLLLLGIWSLRPFRHWFWVALGLLGINFLGVGLHYFVGGAAWSLLSSVSLLAFCIVSAVLTMRFILVQPKVDRNQLLGAASVYLLLGVIWALLFEIVRLFDPSAFTNVDSIAGRPGATGELLYFSYVTLTTLGYGDIAPTIPAAKNLVVLEAVIGQLFLAVLIAVLIGRLAQPGQTFAAQGARGTLRANE